jgi:hypothetical protein
MVRRSLMLPQIMMAIAAKTPRMNFPRRRNEYERRFYERLNPVVFDTLGKKPHILPRVSVCSHGVKHFRPLPVCTNATEFWP